MREVVEQTEARGREEAKMEDVRREDVRARSGEAGKPRGREDVRT